MLRRATIPAVSGLGALFCLLSAVAFGAMGVFGKLAYDEQVSVGTLLAVRFALAALVFWAVLVATRGVRGLRALPARDVLLALALGAVGYGAQAGAFFSALQRLDAGLLSLLLYTFPVLVTAAAVVLGREAFQARRAVALAVASAGLVLVLAGAGTGALDPLGAALGLTAAVVYSGYILTSEGVSRRVSPLALSTLVCTGAAVSVSLGAAATGTLAPGAVTAAGWVWLAGIAVISTVGAIALFFAGLSRVGPSSAAILSTLEPVTTVGLAFAVFGEALGPAQLLGGALVLLAVIALQRPTGTGRAGAVPRSGTAPTQTRGTGTVPARSYAVTSSGPQP